MVGGFRPGMRRSWLFKVPDLSLPHYWVNLSQRVLVEESGRVRLVAQQYARGTAGIGTDQLWTMLGQYGAATLPDGDLY